MEACINPVSLCCHSSNTLNVHTDVFFIVSPHFGSGIVHELYERSIYGERTLPSESFIEKFCILSELPTESEALRESPMFTVKTETAGHSNITSNWISEIQQSVSDQHNRLLEEETTREFSTLIVQLLGSNILLY